MGKIILDSKTAIISLFAIFTLISVKAYADQPQAILPSLIAQEMSYDFGTVFDGEMVRHEYIIENKGQQTFHLRKVHASCGCTTASFSQEIPPGETGRVVIDADTTGYQGRRFTKNVTVITDDPGQPQIKLHISGEVILFASILPPHVQLNGLAGTPIRAEVSIKPGSDSPFNITAVTAKTHQHIEVSWEKRDDGYTVLIENRMSEPGQYFDTVVVKTDHPKKPELFVRVIGRIDGQIPKAPVKPFGLTLPSKTDSDQPEKTSDSDQPKKTSDSDQPEKTTDSDQPKKTSVKPFGLP